MYAHAMGVMQNALIQLFLSFYLILQTPICQRTIFASKNNDNLHWSLGKSQPLMRDRYSRELKHATNNDEASSLNKSPLFMSNSSQPVDCLGCQCKSCFDGHCAEIVKCENGGKMDQKIGGVRFICECSRYFRGQCCQQKLCVGGSTLGEDGECHCKHPNFQSGEHCEQAFCVNGGTSHEGKCRHCPWPWEGDFCEKLMCANGGRWERTENGTQSCRCAGEGRYVGRLCDVDLEGQHHGAVASKSSCFMAVISESSCDHLDSTWIVLLLLLAVAVLGLSTFGYQNWVQNKRRRHLSDWIYAQPPQPVLIPRANSQNNNGLIKSGSMNGGSMTRSCQFQQSGVGGGVLNGGARGNFV